MNLSLRQLRAFEAVSATGSFTAAARRLHLTQSAVSMLVQQLEEELGLQLLDRARTATTLTDAGRQLLPLAQRILEDVRQVAEGASDLRALRRGLLRLVAPQMMACTWAAEVLAAYGESHPEIRIRMTDSTPDDVVANVSRGDAEVGIGPERPTGDEVTGTFLMHVPMRLACATGHPLADRKSVSWKELRGERWITYSGEFNRFLERTLHAHGETPPLHAATEAAYLTTTLALVGNGMGVAVAPAYARVFADTFGVRFLPLRAPVINREYYTYQRRGQALSPAAQAFVGMLRRRAASEERPGAAGRGGA
jgi:DNA-binding transcriptional LysR family regulator